MTVPKKSEKRASMNLSDFDEGMNLIKVEGWQSFDPQQHPFLAAQFLDKYVFLNTYLHVLNTIALTKVTLEENVSPKEKLFELLMRRFDLMSSHKLALKRIPEEAWLDPKIYWTLAPLGCETSAKIIDLAGVEVPPLLGFISTQIFALFLLYITQIWLQDDTPDFEKTMAYLDRGLEWLRELKGVTGSLSSFFTK